MLDLCSCIFSSMSYICTSCPPKFTIEDLDLDSHCMVILRALGGSGDNPKKSSSNFNTFLTFLLNDLTVSDFKKALKREKMHRKSNAASEASTSLTVANSATSTPSNSFKPFKASTSKASFLSSKPSQCYD